MSFLPNTFTIKLDIVCIVYVCFVHVCLKHDKSPNKESVYTLWYQLYFTRVLMCIIHIYMVLLWNMLASFQKNTHIQFMYVGLIIIYCPQSMNYQGIKIQIIKKSLIYFLITCNILCFFFCQMNFQLLWEIFDNDGSIIAHTEKK